MLALFGSVGMASLTGCVTGNRPAPQPGSRLLLTDADLIRARRLITTDPLASRWYGVLRREAEAILAEPPSAREYEPARPVMLLTSRRVLHRVRLLAGLWRLTGDARHATRAKAELVTAASFPDWNPSHFLDTAEMCHAFALGLNWLDGALTPAEITLFRTALVEKGIEPGLAAHAQAVFWTRGTSNWNLVCNGGLILAALALEQAESTKARPLIQQCLASVARAFANYAPDGAWDEGPSYWAYATQYAAFLLAGLESVHGPSALADSDGFAQTGLFGLHMTGPTGRVFNFADAEEENESGPELFWLSRRFNRPLYATYYRPFVGATPSLLDLLWYDPRVRTPQAAGVSTCAYFRHVEVASLRGAWDDPQASWIAVKGGDNRASHGHLDLGSFVLESAGARFAIDLGGDDYALPGYFERPQRFTYYRTASRGHNLLLPDETNQEIDAHAAIIAFGCASDDAYAIVDLDAAWPALAAARRGVRLLARRHLVISDEVQRRLPRSWTWQMHTSAHVTINGPHARLETDGAVLHMTILEPADAGFVLEPARIEPPQLPIEGVSRLAIRFSAAQAPIRVIVLASPDIEPPGAVIALARQPLAAWSG